MNKRILFVDPRVKETRDLLFTMAELEPDWEWDFADSGQAAIARLQGEEWDAVVAELEMPGIDGTKILDAAIQHRPHALRLVLSDMRNRSLLLKCLGTAHQFLARPCDAETLHSALQRAFTLDFWLPNETVARLLGEMTKLPSPPQLYFQVVRELRSETTTLEAIGALIARDPAMTAKILRAVNSAVFGLGKQVADSAEAVLYLGVEATKSMILLAHTYSYYDQVPGMGMTMDQLWQHSLATGCYARAIAAEEGLPHGAREEAYTAGMLHDIGKLVLSANFTDRYRQAAQLVQRKGLEWWEAEQEVFGVNHAEVGACLAAVWGLPVAIVEALALHHHPTLVVNNGVCPLTMVHAANAFEHADASPNAPVRLDRDYLNRLGMSDRVETWQDVCRSQREKASGHE